MKEIFEKDSKVPMDNLLDSILSENNDSNLMSVSDHSQHSDSRDLHFKSNSKVIRLKPKNKRKMTIDD